MDDRIIILKEKMLHARQKYNEYVIQNSKETEDVMFDALYFGLDHGDGIPAARELMLTEDNLSEYVKLSKQRDQTSKDFHEALNEMMRNRAEKMNVLALKSKELNQEFRSFLETLRVPGSDTSNGQLQFKFDNEDQVRQYNEYHEKIKAAQKEFREFNSRN